MEHVVQIGIHIDDEAIKRAVASDARKQIIEKLSKDVRSELGITGRPRCVSEFTEEIAERICDECREEIVDKVARELAEKAPRTKWYREAMLEALAEKGGRSA